MRKAHIEARSGARVVLHRSGLARCTALDGKEHLALIRDISSKGIFFYSDLRPRVDSPVQIAFVAPVSGKETKFVLKARTIRIEDAASGTIGVAARLEPGNFLPTQQVQELRRN